MWWPKPRQRRQRPRHRAHQAEPDQLYHGAGQVANADKNDDDDYFVYQELIGEENRVWVTLDHIPQHLIDAVVAIEDREFYNHHGVSFQRTAYALANELFSFRTRPSAPPPLTSSW